MYRLTNRDPYIGLYIVTPIKLGSKIPSTTKPTGFLISAQVAKRLFSMIFWTLLLCFERSTWWFQRSWKNTCQIGSFANVPIESNRKILGLWTRQVHHIPYKSCFCHIQHCKICFLRKETNIHQNPFIKRHEPSKCSLHHLEIPYEDCIFEFQYKKSATLALARIDQSTLQISPKFKKWSF